MKNLRISILTLSFLIILLASCKKDTTVTCSLYTAIDQTAVGMNIVYTASATGDGTIMSLTYNTSTGPVTVTKPSLPWTVTVYMPQGADVYINGSGNVTNGGLTVDYNGSSDGHTMHASDNCSHQND